MSATIQILMATYNGERFVETQLESILAQTFTNFELLVSDDCSTDATRDILQRFASADERVRLVDSGRRFGGARDNFLWLLAQATAPYVAFCDQDDLWLPDKVELGLKTLHELEGTWGKGAPLLVFSDVAVAAEDLSIIDPSFLSYSGLNPKHSGLARLLVQNLAPGCTVITNRALYHDVLRIPEDVSPVIMHDWWLMLAASALGHIGFVDKPTMLYRQHAHNSVGAEKESALSILGRIGTYAERLVPTSAQLDTIDARLKQASAFARTYADQLGEGDRLLCEGFASLLDRAPLSRLLWCHSHGVRNSTPIMQLGLDWELLLYDLGRRGSGASS